ncbi:MAG: protocatechuate 3,4-dioxygenase [Betaproteobacteria bacterium]
MSSSSLKNTVQYIPTCPEQPSSRRALLKAALALGAMSLGGTWRGAAAASETMPTPDQILGPFYPVRKASDGGNDLTRVKGKAGSAQGEVIYVMGRVLNMRGEPVRAAQLEIWQANGAGRYTHPNDRNPAPIDPNFDGYGVVTTDAEGRYRFKTVKPGAYPTGFNDYTRPPHIHFDVRGEVNRLITQMYFPNEPLNEKDFLLQQSWAKDRLIAQVLPPTSGEEPTARLVVWDIVLIQG